MVAIVLTMGAAEAINVVWLEAEHGLAGVAAGGVLRNVFERGLVAKLPDPDGQDSGDCRGAGLEDRCHSLTKMWALASRLGVATAPNTS